MLNDVIYKKKQVGSHSYGIWPPKKPDFQVDNSFWKKLEHCVGF